MLPADDVRRIRSLASMARVLGRSESLPRLLEIAAEAARGALHAASVSVSRLVPGTCTIRTIVNVGDLGPDEVRWPTDESYTLEDFKYVDPGSSEAVTWRAERDDPATAPEERALLEQLHKGSSVDTPLMVDGAVWGEFYATRHVGEAGFSADDVAYLEALTAILAGAISRCMREQSLEQMAYRDPLTGLMNRRSLDEWVAATFADAEPHPVSVLVVDINDLKLVNDTWGHEAGDELILTVGRALAVSFADLPDSLVARVGGDEFTVVVSRHDPAAVQAAADRVCARRGAWSHSTGISCGLASATVVAGTEWASGLQPGR
ncbi:MAG TPA: sensor domain-containing diguanylate cyclase [Nocardioidaceae bacterium]|nr:sensor domain-containing diguanylate cyclase [Nocardioidaceae bacterium]